MNLVDLIFGLVIVLAMARGWSRGVLSTLAAYIAPVLGFMFAADVSDPVRDQLARMIDAPDIALDVLAPVTVFLVVVLIVRLIAALLARLLGVGRSLPGRVLGAAASGFVVAVLIGAAVLVVRDMSPQGARAAREGGTQEPERGTDPLADLVVDVERQLDESLLAPYLSSLATTTWNKLTGRAPDTPLSVTEEIEATQRKANEAMREKANLEMHREIDEAIRPKAAPAATPDKPRSEDGKPGDKPNR